MIAGIAIDSYKLAIFDRHLKQAGYKYEIVGKIGAPILTLKIQTDNVEALGHVVQAANDESINTNKGKLQ